MFNWGNDINVVLKKIEFYSRCLSILEWILSNLLLIKRFKLVKNWEWRISTSISACAQMSLRVLRETADTILFAVCMVMAPRPRRQTEYWSNKSGWNVGSKVSSIAERICNKELNWSLNAVLITWKRPRKRVKSGFITLWYSQTTPILLKNCSQSSFTSWRNNLFSL